MEKHITLVGALNIGFGILGLIASLIIVTIFTFAGIMSGDLEAFSIISVVAFSITIFIIIFSILDIICGIGLLYKKPWARVFALILAVLDLVQIPIGTVIGMYSIWVLIQDETVMIFNSKGLQ